MTIMTVQVYRLNEKLLHLKRLDKTTLWGVGQTESIFWLRKIYGLPRAQKVTGKLRERQGKRAKRNDLIFFDKKRNRWWYMDEKKIKECLWNSTLGVTKNTFGEKQITPNEIKNTPKASKITFGVLRYL